MPKIRYLATWCRDYQKLLTVSHGYVVFKYDDFYRENLGKVLLKIEKWQNRQKEKHPDDYLKELVIDVEYHYRKRTLDQNKLMWALYEIEKNEMNGGQSGDKKQLVSREELYMNDLDEFGERETINTKRKNLGYYLSEYKIIEAIITNEGKEISLKKFVKMEVSNDERISIRVIRGTSKLNTIEMSKWIERVFNRLAYNGVQVTNPGEIENYWHTWKTFLNENKITLHDEIMTQEEYRVYNPICEACGKYIEPGTGELSHIKAIGMGGDRDKEPKRNYSSNWLYLHAVPCHREHWHSEGIKKFLKRYKHLTYKVNTALRRNYKPINDLYSLSNEKDNDLYEKDEKKQGRAHFDRVCGHCGDVLPENGECPCGGLGYF